MIEKDRERVKGEERSEMKGVEEREGRGTKEGEKRRETIFKVTMERTFMSAMQCACTHKCVRLVSP